ncbi:hypothetical protein GCM10025868_09290 [Angustibacter aerolatus]|uniref:Transcriptional regulator SbtR-like C-terminal domain-containing protein n=1 Tax=Angustibacter aerolatus TaxID=1162965 RepID=A0ABQ6JD25_9ACTN|nr:hypothetical protein [Angustibacter aerolatus]GMA85679.1 hypothetical protein GCM10025868_09290 [Angustibacter aerolatus]
MTALPARRCCRTPPATASLAEQTLRPVAQRLVQRALESGRVRPDVRESDLPMLFLAAGALASATVPVREDLWQRYVDALLDGLLLHDADRRGGQVPAPSPVEPARGARRHPAGPLTGGGQAARNRS